jgi:mRNA interferase YafQ
MLEPLYATAFERDLKRLEKRGKDIDRLKTVIELIIAEMPLEATHRDHPLKGDWVGCRDCHVEPDWVLIYAIQKKTVTFMRTGTHSDLF